MLLAVALLGACQEDETLTESARKGGSITVGLGARPDSLDPAVAAAPDTREALWLAYTPPLTYARAEGVAGAKLVPGLAEALPRISDDGRSYAFNFRAGLRYSNGAPLRARDFAHTIERARSLGPRGRELFSGVRRIDSDDRRRRVVVHLRRPDSTFPYALADTAAGLVPRQTPVRVGVPRPPPGIGPYVVGALSPTGGFSMRRRRGLDLPGIPAGNVDRIAVRVVTSPEKRARAVIGGGLDYATGPPPSELLPLIRSKYRDRYDEHRTESSLWLAMNTRRKPFDNERVRQAVSLSVDGDKLDRLMLGFLEPGCNFIPRDMSGYRRLDPCPYGNRTAAPNLVKARALVEKAGARGERVTLGARQDAVGHYFAGTLRKLGLRIRRVPPTARAQVRLAGWQAGLPHPAELFRLVRGQDAAVDVESASLTREPLDRAETSDAWAALDRRLVEGAFVAPYGSAVRNTFLSERLDFANCSRFHPVYGNDWSSFCLK